MEDTTLAYIAGAMDSDGCIGVRRSTYAMRVRGDASGPMYSERVMLKHVTPEVPALLKESFGGTLRLDNPSAKRGRPLWSWQVTDKKAAAMLEAMLPFLLVKRAQAENCLRLRRAKEQSRRERVSFGRGHVGGAKRSDAMSVEMEECYQEAKRLNKVGTRVIHTAFS